MSKPSSAIMLACNCLNIIIELDKQIENVNKEVLKLTEEERNDAFFRQSTFLKSKLVNITKVHACLVSTRQAGQWIVTHCINCDVHIHAFQKENGALSVLVNPKLLNSEPVNNIRLTDIYSPVFQIVVNPNDVGSNDSPLEAYRSRELEKFIKYVNDVLTNSIRKEELATEERIKKYTEEQLDNLNSMKDRADKEREALVRLLVDAHSANKSLSLPPDSPKKFFPSNKTSPANKFFGPGSPAATPASPKRPKGTEAVKGSTRSEDLMFQFETDNYSGDEFLFPSTQPTKCEASEELLFDDFGDQDLTIQEESDEGVEDEDEDSGITIGMRSRNSSSSIAKSCPVAIPNFGSLSRSRGRDSEDLEDFMNISEQQNVPENVDIAASIKALANSVHGDSIFGELPRPRFSTQI